MSLFPETEPAAPYRVLARKYRPAGFSALIGQDAVVQTLANAIATGRLAQAWLLTGVRGVGKTSTARIIAKALNCIGPDGEGGPTIDPCGQCANCVAIAAGQHIDVIEIDAASNTGVDNIREIIEAVRYASVSARYKFYIIDEVHMLSKGAFNALLKTLEEPPPHVKFVLATTEVQKVPATILSRCQRFDLKRVPADALAAHFAHVCASEGVAAEPAALDLIARAAEGSVRDGLSILDQAIAMGAGGVTAADVQAMLGLADRGRVTRLLGALIEGDAAAALAALAEAHEAGVAADALFAALLEAVHGITLAHLAGSADRGLPEEERARQQAWAEGLGFPLLHRLWQLLLKGHQEIIAAPDPRAAADMAALRIVHAARLPDPSEVARLLAGGAPAALTAPASAPQASTGPTDFAALVALAEQQREAMLAKQLRDDVACVSLAPGLLRLARTGRVEPGFERTLAAHLARWTGQAWDVAFTDAPAPSLRQQEEAREAARTAAALADPAVAELMAAFPTARLLEVSPGERPGEYHAQS